MLLTRFQHASGEQILNPTCPLQGFAVKAGVLCARGDLILMADADGATVAADEKRLEESLMELHASLSHSSVSMSGRAVAGSQPDRMPANARLGVAVGSRAHMQQQVRTFSVCRVRVQMY